MDHKSRSSPMAPPNHISHNALDKEHHDALARALRNVLHTDLALTVYAQLIDGLPTAETAIDQVDSFGPEPGHPIYQHEEICAGAVDRAQELRDKFTINQLAFDSKLIRAYNDAPFLSKAFNLRLIELTARALHQIGVFLFQQDEKLHDPDTTDGMTVEEVTQWEYIPDGPGLQRVPAGPTLFQQPLFDAHEQYPNGIADIAGYWAEDRIIGGVVLFDRCQSWDEEDEPNAYFQSCRYGTDPQVWQLLDDQQARLLSFLLDDSEDTDLITRPIPVFQARDNPWVFMDDAIPVHSIYRDVWERAPPQKSWKTPCLRFVSRFEDFDPDELDSDQ